MTRKNSYGLTYEGVYFPSIEDFAKTFDLSREVVRKRLAAGGEITEQWIDLAQTRKLLNRRPVTIGERTWPSQSALARYLGVDHSYISLCLREGRIDLIEKRLTQKTD